MQVYVARSSANCDILMLLGRLLMTFFVYIMYNKGLNTPFCGTPLPVTCDFSPKKSEYVNLSFEINLMNFIMFSEQTI